MVQLCGHGKECCNASYKSKPNSRYKKCNGDKCGKPGCLGCKLEAIHLTTASRSCPLCTRKICSEGCVTKCPHRNGVFSMGMMGGDLVEGQLAAAIAGAAAAASNGMSMPIQPAPVHHGSQQSMLYQALQRIAGLESSQQLILSRLGQLDTSINVLTQTISITFALQAGQPGNQAQAQALSQLLANQLMSQQQQQQQQQQQSRVGSAMDMLQQAAGGDAAALADLALQHHLLQQQRRGGRDGPSGAMMDLADLSVDELQQQHMLPHEHEAAVAAVAAAHAAAAAAAAVGHQQLDQHQQHHELGQTSEHDQQMMMEQAMHASVEHAMQTLVGAVKADSEAQAAASAAAALQQQQQQLQQPMLMQQGGDGVPGQNSILLPILPLNSASQQQDSADGGDEGEEGEQSE